MNGKTLKSVLLGTLVLTGFTGLYAQMGGPAPTVLVGRSVQIKEDGYRKYTGEVEAIEEINLVARVSGYLTAIHFQEGDLIQKGTPLIDIEDTTYQASLKSAEAKYGQIQAEMEYATKNYERQKSLYDKNIASQSAFEEASRLYHYNKARLAEIEASLIDAKNNLSYTKLIAPITGRIGKATYSVGNYVSPSSQKLAELVQVSPIYVRFAISEPDCLDMFGSSENMRKEAVIRLKTANRKLFGEIGKIAFYDNKVDSSTGTIMVWTTFENKDLTLIPGGLVDVMISKRIQEVKTAVPTTAPLITRNSATVYVLGKDNMPLPRPVALGAVIGDMQIIESGLEPGELIIIDGIHKVRPGNAVNPKFTEDAKSAVPAAPATEKPAQK